MGRIHLEEDPGRAVVLQLVMSVAVARRPVGKLKVLLDRVALEMKLLTALHGAKAVEAVAVIVQLDRLLLPGQDLVGLVLATQDEQRLRPAHPRVGAERPVIRSDRRLEREHRAPRLATGEQHTALLEGELALDARL